MMHEMMYWQSACFITLTYEDKFLPEKGGLSKKDVYLFIKRLRKIKAPLKIKYYAGAEYGDDEGRPHYHAIIFGVGITEHTVVKYGDYLIARTGPVWQAWQREGEPIGRIQIGSVTGESARYCVKYLHKRYNGKMRFYYGELERPFSIQSNGLGKQWALDNIGQLSKMLVCKQGSKDVNIPKYYKRLFEKALPSYRMDAFEEGLKIMAQENTEEQKRRFYEKHGIKTLNVRMETKFFDELEQKEKNLIAREEIKNAQ